MAAQFPGVHSPVSLNHNNSTVAGHPPHSAPEWTVLTFEFFTSALLPPMNDQFEWWVGVGNFLIGNWLHNEPIGKSPQWWVAQ